MIGIYAMFRENKIGTPSPYANPYNYVMQTDFIFVYGDDRASVGLCHMQECY